MAFYTTLAKHYSTIFPLTQAHITLFKSIISESLKTGLDVGCGTGILTQELQKQGLNMVGIDLSDTMITYAKTLENDRLKFKVCDMTKLRESFEDASFDIITCLGNTLVHIPFEDVEAVLNDFHQLLCDKGTLILQIVNYDMIFNEQKTSLPILENDELVFKRFYEFFDDSNQLKFKAELIDKKQVTHEYDETTLYPLFHSQLTMLLNECFDIQYTLGSWLMNPYDKEHSPSLIIVAIKK
jgi:glycine/sarcosine N-methyltransferase